MRLTALHLERYGPFQDHCLTFAEDVRLHLVLGRNEAGKTSALAAVGDLLYGIPPTSPYAFRHAKATLRIGAEIVGGDGRRLSFVRRNGRLNTLLDANGEPLAEGSLDAFLSGVDRAAFGQAFGLDAARLEAGAQAMLSTRGEIGESMFAAASGLGALSELRAALQAEAEAIFAPRRAGHRAFYQALDRHRDAEASLRASEVAARDWAELGRAIETAETARRDARRRWQDAVRETRRIEALERAVPIVGDLAALDRELAALGPLPDTEPDFAGRLEEALADDREAAALEAAVEADGKARAAAEAITVDERILAHAAAVEAVFSERAGVRERRGRLDDCIAGVARDCATSAQLAARLGLDDLNDLESVLPRASEAAAIRASAKEGQAISDRLTQLEEERAEALADIERLERARPEGAVDVDPAPLRERFSVFDGMVRQAEEQVAADAALTTRASTHAEAVARLDPPIESLDDLAATPLPAPEAVADHEKERERLRHARRDAERDHDQAAGEIAAIETEIARFAAGKPLVTADAMAAARAERDTLFATVAALATGAPCTADPDAAIAAYRRQRDHVDALADAAVEGSDRTAALAHREHARDTVIAKREAATARLCALQEEEARQDTAWQTLWQGIAARPHEPGRMRAWLAAVGDLLEQRAALRAVTGERDAAKIAAAAALPALTALARELGLETTVPLGDALAGLIDLARAVEVRLRAHESAFRQRLADVVRLDETRARLARHEREVATQRAARERWQAEWCARLDQAGLSHAWSPPEALAALDAFDEAARHVADAGPRERALAESRCKLAAFDARIAELAVLVDEPAGGAPERLAERLHERLDRAKLAAVRREEAAKAAAAAAIARAGAAEHRNRSSAALDALTAALPVDLRELPLQDLCRRLKARDNLLARRSERLRDLATLADGRPLEALRAEVAAFDPVEAQARRLELEREVERQQRASEEAFAGIERLEERREAMEANVGAEHAAAMVRAAEAELATHARDYLVRKVAATMLIRAAERHRAQTRGRLLARADELFAALTCGAFAAIEEVVDDSGELRVAGRRPDGEIVEVAGMSEGSRAQFYLALRLAYLERFAARGAAPPLIADDLFTSFDERRTEAGLRVLAEIGATLQPILFTHHRFLADIAVRALGSDVEIIDLDRSEADTVRAVPRRPAPARNAGDGEDVANRAA